MHYNEQSFKLFKSSIKKVLYLQLLPLPTFSFDKSPHPSNSFTSMNFKVLTNRKTNGKSNRPFNARHKTNHKLASVPNHENPTRSFALRETFMY